MGLLYREQAALFCFEREYGGSSVFTSLAAPLGIAVKRYNNCCLRYGWKVFWSPFLLRQESEIVDPTSLVFVSPNIWR